MDAGLRTPLIEAFRRPDVPKEVRLDAASGQVAPRGLEQLALLMHLSDDEDAEVRAAAAKTLDGLPGAAVAAAIGRADAPAELVRFFTERGVVPVSGGGDDPLSDGAGDTSWEGGEAGAGADDQLSVTQQIQQMSIVQRVRAAMKGSREMRAMLIRDPNKLVASAVLSSPKLTLAEVEAFAKMANVTEDVLRAIGANRAWVKNYGVALGLTRNPKAPVALSLNLLQRLVERDVKALAADRNVPEPLRLAARKRMVTSQSR